MVTQHCRDLTTARSGPAKLPFSRTLATQEGVTEADLSTGISSKPIQIGNYARGRPAGSGLAGSEILLDPAGRSDGAAGRKGSNNGAVAGGFAAPEQISPSCGRIGPGTDIYAVGGLAYWYLAGNAPHDKGTSEASLASTSDGPLVRSC